MHLYFVGIPTFLKMQDPETVDISLQKVHLRCTASKIFFTD